jgi:hypothetical protein
MNAETVVGQLIARDGYHGIALARPVAERATIVVAQAIADRMRALHHEDDDGYIDTSSYESIAQMIEAEFVAPLDGGAV